MPTALVCPNGCNSNWQWFYRTFIDIELADDGSWELPSKRYAADHGWFECGGCAYQIPDYDGPEALRQACLHR